MSDDELQDVKDAVDKHEEDLIKQEEAVSKLIDDSNKDKKVTEHEGDSCNTGTST